MFVCLSLVGGRGRSNFCDVNCARRYFEAAKLLMSEIVLFPASLELYNSFDTLFVCFHGLMNNL